MNRNLTLFLLRGAPILLFAVILIGFGFANDRYLSITNFRNVLIQAAPIAILAIGMTFVLLIAEIDLSVGAVMYVLMSIVALVMEPDSSTGAADPHLWWPVSLIFVLVGGAFFGILHGLIVTRIRVVSFITTLSTLFIIRGVAMYLSNTRTLLFSADIRSLNRLETLSLFGKGTGIPFAILVLIIVLAVAWVLLEQTPFGRQIYAVGADREAAQKAGLPVVAISTACFVLCGLCAGLGGFVAATQQGAVGPNFGFGIEFQVIAAAVLGGVSLFGGRGTVWGPLFGAILIRATIAGLTFMNADPYLYPLVTAAIIFLAVAVDGLRTRMLDRMNRRTIRPLETT
jgi:ribose transport system permease protein